MTKLGNVMVTRRIGETVSIGAHTLTPRNVRRNEGIMQIEVRTPHKTHWLDVSEGDHIDLHGSDINVWIRSIHRNKLRMLIQAPVALRITRPEAERVQ